jgi:glycosyltransferase involved in cell wall biosynthesis
MDIQNPVDSMSKKANSLSVCYFGTYRENYSRNRIMIEGLRIAGINVIECHETLWQGVEDRIQIAEGGWLHPGFWWRVIKAYTRLLHRFHLVKDYDILIVGYPGQYDVFLARILSWIRRKPLVWDVLNSMYLITVERGLARKHPFTASLIHYLESIACRLPDRLFLDTPAFVAWFEKTYGVGKERFRLVPIGADDQVFQQVIRELPAPTASPTYLCHLLYFGSYIPNHGVDVIIEAARLLQDDETIRFELVGDGLEKKRAADLAEKYNLKNLTFINWLDKTELARKVMACDICLGTFGDTLQASLTNNNKIYEGFAFKKPVISGATAALPEALKNGQHLYLCERGNPQALASAILTLKNDQGLCQRLGEMGYRILHEQFDVQAIGEVTAGYLDELMK